MSERLERLINLVIALRQSRRPVPAATIRERVAGYGQPDHEAFRRMFERDKADLRKLGVPIETVPLDLLSDEVGYRIDPRAYDLPEIRLEPHELAALAVAVHATGLAADAGVGLLKLAVDAGEPGGHRASSVPLAVDLAHPHHAPLMQAQLTRTTVRFTYVTASGTQAQRRVDPYALVHRRGRWYVVGFDHDRQERRAFRLDRVVGAVTTASTAGAFEPAADVRVDDVVPAREHPPLQAQVRASPEVAWQLARQATGAGEPGDDGWSLFSVTVDDADRFVDWLLEYGPDVEVLAPLELRAAIRDRVVTVARRYA